MRTRDVAEGLNFLTMGRKNVLRAFFFFFQTFSLDNKVYKSCLVFAETPARRGFVGVWELSNEGVISVQSPVGENFWNILDFISRIS